MAENNTSYGNIFKTTFLFGFVQVFRAVMSIIKNKVAAILIGAEGMGILGIFSSTAQMIQTGAGLGINQSAVRDISEANGADNYNRFSKIISVTNKVILYTGLLGCIITLCLSYWLSEWTFGDTAHIVGYCILSVAIALNIMNESKQAILKGMRRLKALAYASMLGSAAGLITSVPLYYFFGKEGIVPELLISAIVGILVSEYYVKKIDYTKQPLSLSETFKEAKPMVKMGVALMLMTFLQTIASFIINAYIRSVGGLEDVGYFSAGTAILNSYFGIIITALMTDYYPRIAAVNQDNSKLQEELNKQSLVSVVLCCPMFILFMTLLPTFIKILYSESFLPTVDFVKWSIYYTLITVCSNQVDMILVAKFNSKVFLALSIFFRIFLVAACIGLYSSLGLEGLGFAYMLFGIAHLFVMSFTVYKLYKIRFSGLFIKVGLCVLLFAVASSLVQQLMTGSPYYLVSVLLLITSCIFSYYISVKYIKLDFIGFINKRMKRK